jgi:4,5-DOPA dioxygenase extradiol
MTMPALFVGHGAPMNAVEDTAFARSWRALGESLPRPKAILCVSAHWVEHGIAITASDRPATVHDFYGFPPEYYRLSYPAPGDAALVARTAALFAPVTVRPVADRGFDHGTWSVLMRMYPEADIPVVQLGLDADRPLAAHFDLARKLGPLRDEGVLVIGSGNIVHNLGMLRFGANEAPDWALRFDSTVRAAIEAGDHDMLADPRRFGEDWRLAVPTAEHYVPMLYALALRREADSLNFFNESVSSTLSMTSFVLQ